MATRQTFYAESNTESTTTSTSDQDKVTLTQTPDANSDYFIFGCSLLGYSGSTADTRHKLVNTTSATTFNTINVEAKDATDYTSFFGATKETFGASPASQTWKIQYSSESGLHTAKIKEGRILAVKKDSNDQYAESLGDSTTTSASFQTKVTLTWTPGSQGNYTFVFVADVNDNNTGALFVTQLDVDGTTQYVASDRYIDDTTSYVSIMGVVPGINLTAASHTITLQFKSDGTNTVTIRNAKIIALRESDFDVAQTVRQGTRQTRTASTYADVTGATLTFTPAAVEHIIFAGSIFDHSSITSSGYNQLLEGSTTIAEMTEEPTNTAEDMPFLTFYRKTLAASSTTWAIQHKAESTGTVGSDELAIAVFQTEASGTVYNDSITETVTATESGSILLSGIVAKTETATPSETGLASMTAGVSAAETITASESATAGLLYENSLSETVTVTESATTAATGNVSQSESSTATDSATALSSGAVTASESSTATESAVAASASSLAATETITPTDVYTTTILASDGVTEITVMTDDVAALAAMNPIITETIAANDNAEATQDSVTPAEEPEPVRGSGDEHRRRRKKKPKKPVRPERSILAPTPPAPIPIPALEESTPFAPKNLSLAEFHTALVSGVAQPVNPAILLAQQEKIANDIACVMLKARAEARFDTDDEYYFMMMG